MILNHKNLFLFLMFAAIAVGLFFAGRFYYQNLRGLGPAIKTAPQDIIALIPSDNVSSNPVGQNINSATIPNPQASSPTPAGYPLKLPVGFFLNIFAKNLPGARVMVFDSVGNLWLSQTREGIVNQLIIKDGRPVEQNIIFKNLDNPHGLAFDPQDPNILYVAEETRISKVVLAPDGPGELKKIIDLPTGGNHFTRTLGFGPDGRLYVSIGSTCNVCLEKDPRRAAIYSLNKDGSDWRLVARGLRNSVFFVWNPQDGRMWATEMGRDLLGDTVPPDEINVIDTATTTVVNFGWPICYGQNIHDTVFDKNTYIRNPCQIPFEQSSRVDLPAHSAPLGLAFVPEPAAWPTEYQNNLLVAFHGSWNRSIPTGYKIVRLVLDDRGELIKQEDFISGWLTESGALGRPVDLVFDAAGTLYISDDQAGVIYVVRKY